MSIAGAYFAGIVSTLLILLGLKLLAQRHATMGWAIIIAVILFTIFGGYVSFSL